MGLRLWKGACTLVLGAAALVAVGSLDPVPLHAADVKLQDLIGGGGQTSRVTADVKPASAEFNEVGFKIGSQAYKNDFNDDRWRKECFAFQGMGQLDDKYLDFVYGGDDVIVFCFTAPQVKNGGQLKITATLAADPGDVEISTSSANQDYKKVAAISRLGTLEVDLPPCDGPELYLMLDGRRGNGVVVDDLAVTFNAEGPTPSPTPTPTPAPAVKDDRPGYSDRVTPGTTRGNRYEFDRHPDTVTPGNRDRSNIVPPTK